MHFEIYPIFPLLFMHYSGLGIGNILIAIGSFVFDCRYAQDDPTNQRPASSLDPHPEEQTWESAGELYWLGRQDCWQVSELEFYGSDCSVVGLRIEQRKDLS